MPGSSVSIFFPSGSEQELSWLKAIMAVESDVARRYRCYGSMGMRQVYQTGLIHRAPQFILYPCIKSIHEPLSRCLLARMYVFRVSTLRRESEDPFCRYQDGDASGVSGLLLRDIYHRSHGDTCSRFDTVLASSSSCSQYSTATPQALALEVL